MIKAYSVFDDFSPRAVQLFRQAGIGTVLHPSGAPRPDSLRLREIMEEYDILIIGTGQKMDEKAFEPVSGKKIIATASIGTDHIKIPDNKKKIVKMVNAPKSNRISVAEHSIGMILTLKKRLIDGYRVSLRGENKKQMSGAPTDLYGSILGVIGAGGTACELIRLALAFGMKILCWTRNPGAHRELALKGVEFTDLDPLLRYSDIISVNLPLVPETEQIISKDKIALIKKDSVFISLSRAEITNLDALFARAKRESGFSLALDMDTDKIRKYLDKEYDNILVTPHIAGGTIQARQRMFMELCENVLSVLPFLGYCPAFDVFDAMSSAGEDPSFGPITHKV